MKKLNNPPADGSAHRSNVSLLEGLCFGKFWGDCFDVTKPGMGVVTSTSSSEIDKDG
jgi:hypothetical protein